MTSPKDGEELWINYWLSIDFFDKHVCVYCESSSAHDKDKSNINLKLIDTNIISAVYCNVAMFITASAHVEHMPIIDLGGTLKTFDQH